MCPGGGTDYKLPGILAAQLMQMGIHRYFNCALHVAKGDELVTHARP